MKGGKGEGFGILEISRGAREERQGWEAGQGRALPSMCRALGSIPVLRKKKKKGKRREGSKGGKEKGRVCSVR